MPRTNLGTSKDAKEHRKWLFKNELITNGFNVSKAAIAAGYSEKGAYLAGMRLLEDATLRAEIDAAREKLRQASDAGPERIQRELNRIALFDPRKLYREDGTLKDPHEWDDDTAAVVASLDVEELWEGRGKDKLEVGRSKKLRLWDKTNALDKLARIHGLYERDNIQRRPDLSIQIAVVPAEARRPPAGVAPAMDSASTATRPPALDSGAVAARVRGKRTG